MQRLRVFSGLLLPFLFAFLFECTDLQAQRPKPLAKGVLKTIPEDMNPRDMFSLPRPLPGLNAVKYEPLTFPYRTSLHGQTGRVVLFRDNVWQYEFAFTGLRQADLQLPGDDGEFESKLVWYIVYRIRDTGKTMTFEQVKQNPEFDHIKYDLRKGEAIPREERKFLPRFTLEGSIAQGEGGYRKVVYRDVINPLAVEQIRMREDKNLRLLDTHQMSEVSIPKAKSDSDPGVWGVAIWENVDPRIDFVSVFVKGLTNAFRLGDSMKDDNQLKTLQLNFWRPGDAFLEARDSVAFGVPLVDDPKKQILICKRFNLPGPVMRGYFVNKVAKRDVLVVEADAMVDFKTFQSKLVPDLDRGRMPASIAAEFKKAGIAVGGAVKTLVKGQKWSLQVGEDEYIVALEPQFWAPDYEKIRFIKRLDYMWIYR
ncbi:MAG: hypothetical protein AAF939_15530 [Planctomycetota bacterium]